MRLDRLTISGLLNWRRSGSVFELASGLAGEPSAGSLRWADLHQRMNLTGQQVDFGPARSPSYGVVFMLAREGRVPLRWSMLADVPGENAGCPQFVRIAKFRCLPASHRYQAMASIVIVGSLPARGRSSSAAMGRGRAHPVGLLSDGAVLVERLSTSISPSDHCSASLRVLPPQIRAVVRR
jgi:hypothetical protein